MDALWLTRCCVHCRREGVSSVRVDAPCCDEQWWLKVIHLPVFMSRRISTNNNGIVLGESLCDGTEAEEVLAALDGCRCTNGLSNEDG